MKIRDFMKKNYLLLALVMITLFFAVVTKGKLFYMANIRNLFQQNMYVFILASGMFVCILTGGNIDLSLGSSVFLIGAIGASLMESGLNGMIAFAIMLLIGALIGMLNGYLIGRSRLPSLIVTLAGMYIIRGIGNLILGGYTLSVTDSSFLSLFGISDKLSFSYIFTVLSILMAVYISESAPIGRHIYALGGNREAARTSGISEEKIIMFAYVFMGILTALTAAVVMGRMGIVGPGLGETYAMDAIAACFIGGMSVTGGKGKMSGVVIGALLMGIINQGMSITGLSVSWQNVIKGIVLVLAVLLGYFMNRKGRMQR